jgi:nitrogenase molybdenum-cofactor synthesis protein NifE
MSEKKQAVYYTIEELAQRGKDDIPEQFISGNHLIYSSPATLAFNSPGAEGFGVKRAGLAVPESVMLIVAPGCCGRNTSLISRMPEYNNRFFYLNMDETDIITGRHLKKIPQAIREIVDFLENKPSVVMICITCVDALLGTDMERVCKKAQEEVHLPVRPCYMYALTREGRKPPMVHVRQSIYSLLEPRKKKGTVVDILGFFAPLADTSELYELLRKMGVKTTYEISRCATYEEYQHMSEANFALVLNPETRYAAKDFEERLHIPSIELTRFYETDRIAKQYAAFFHAIGVTVDDSAHRARAEEAVQQFQEKYKKLHFSIGECLNADPFELALALLKYGYAVDEIFGTITAENFVYIRAIRELSPDTKVYSNLHPSMIYYEDAQDFKSMDVCGKADSSENMDAREEPDCFRMMETHAEADGIETTASREKADDFENMETHVTIGKDAGYYHPSCPNLAWNSDVQPWGFQAVWSLFESLDELLGGHQTCEVAERNKIGKVSGGSAKEKTEETSGNSAKEKTEETSGNSAKEKTEETSGNSTKEKTEETSVNLTKERTCEVLEIPAEEKTENTAEIPANISVEPQSTTKGLFKYLTPFAPDQSGAVSVLYEFGGLLVICDAGGCTGNICGFDEPRWSSAKSAIFSAGLRDMDAIMGRDEHLVTKLALAAEEIEGNFAAVIGTPVPSVIATDYVALSRMLEKKTSLPVIAVNSTGMSYYDRGAEAAYLALVKQFSTEAFPVEPGRIGVFGANPLDLGDLNAAEKLKHFFQEKGEQAEVFCYGMGAGLDALIKASAAEKNIVVAPSGLKAAKYLKEQFGTPYEIVNPLALQFLPKIDVAQKRVLVIGQQVSAHTLRVELLKRGAGEVVAADFFMQLPELLKAQDIRLTGEHQCVELLNSGRFDVIIADPVFRKMVKTADAVFAEYPQFSVSGQLVDEDSEAVSFG